jgi:Tfp pilus assembly PilM family ATPase
VRHIRIPRVPRKQIANAVYWTVKKETPFDEREMLLDFENQGEVIEQGIPKLSVMVYTAPRREIEELRELFGRIGRPLTGISIVPFSLQNLFRTDWIAAPDGNIASLFIGNDFSRIDIYSGDNLVMTRGIKAGMSSMVEALIDRFGELASTRAVPPLSVEQGRKILRSLSPDSPPLERGDAGFGVPQEQIFEMILPALERLTRQAERTFEHYTTTTSGERIVRIYVTGAMNVCQPIIDYVGSQLGITSSVLDPLSEQDAAACPDLSDRRCISERIAFGPALGLALSDNRYTPNLIFTYKDREKAASVVRINRAVFAAFLASVLICGGIFAFQNHAIREKKAALAGIERQIAAIGLSVDRDQLTKMAGKLTERRQLSRIYADRYLDVVLIGELAALTPSNIRFIELKITRGPAGGAAAGPAREKGKDAPKAAPEEIILEGIVLGDRQSLEPALAVYTMSLEASPLFRQVIVQKSSVEPYLKSETLHFILNLKVEEQVHG